MALKRKKDKAKPDDEVIDLPNEWSSATATNAPRPMALGRRAGPEPPPQPSYIGPIATLIFCCMPLGIIAIAYAVQVPVRWKRGDESGARLAAERSEFWMYAGVGSGILLHIAWWAFYLLSFRYRNEYGA